MTQSPTPAALAAAVALAESLPDRSEDIDTDEVAKHFDAHTKDLQNTIARLTRELGEARDAEAAEIVAWLRNGKHELNYIGAAARDGQGMYWPEDFAAQIARLEHRKELSHD